MIPSARKGRYHDVTWRLVDLLLDDPDEMVQKAVGWALKEASRADPEAVIGFLRARRDTITSLAMGHAVQRLSREQRDHVRA